MARVTADEVKEIIDVDSSITNLTPFITAANLLVNAECTDSSLSDELLKEIERWLSAHFIAIRDTRSASEGAGSVRISYQYKLGLNLNVTLYGQQCLLLDTSGALARLNKGKVHASVSFVGGDLSDELENT